MSEIEKSVFNCFEEIKRGHYNGRHLHVLRSIREHSQQSSDREGIRLSTSELLFLMYHDGMINSNDDLQCLSQNLEKCHRKKRLIRMKSPSNITRCGVCDVPASQKCGKCRKVFYCKKEHQLMHWNEHKKACLNF